MTDDWGSTGVPEDNPKLPMMEKYRSLISQDIELAQARHVGGFTARQQAQGFRQPLAPRPPEVNIGAVLDLGS